MDVNTQFGAKVRELRKKRKWSMIELGLRANINRNYICDLENGRRNPTLNVIERLAQAFNLTISELVFGLELVETKSNR